jgi:hypothetical protein
MKKHLTVLVTSVLVGALSLIASSASCMFPLSMACDQQVKKCPDGTSTSPSGNVRDSVCLSKDKKKLNKTNQVDPGTPGSTTGVKSSGLCTYYECFFELLNGTRIVCGDTNNIPSDWNQAWTGTVPGPTNCSSPSGSTGGSGGGGGPQS